MLLAFVLLLASPHAFALRCGNQLANREMQDFQVRDRCGDPFWTESYAGYDVIGSSDTGQIAREVQFQVWYYNFGPHNLMHRLLFRDGVLKQDDTLSYGVSDIGSKCDPLMRFVDLSVGELVAFCGEPASRRQNSDTFVNRLAPEYRRIREQRRELWIYDFGESRFLRQLQLVRDAKHDLDSPMRASEHAFGKRRRAHHCLRSSPRAYFRAHEKGRLRGLFRCC